MEPRPLEELIQDFGVLEIGTEYPVCGTRCIFCTESEELLLTPVLGPVEESLPGRVPNPARRIVAVTCRGCGRTSEGKL